MCIYIILTKNNDEKLNKCEFVHELPIYECIFNLSKNIFK